MRTGITLGITALTALSFMAGAAATPAAAEIEAMLRTAGPVSLFPELDAADPQALLETPSGRALFEWAQTILDEIPQLTYSLYRTFRRTGTRVEFDTPYRGRRRMLTQASLLAWFEPSNAAHIDRVSDVVWAICEETTWVSPPSEGPEWVIDLTNAETAAQLAAVTLLLGDRVPEEVRERMRQEVDRRILTNFLEHHDSDRHWWADGRNNWTGACAGAIGEAALVFERDPERLARILALVAAHLNRYIENGFEADGGCLEGVDYWRYGLLCLVSCSKMLAERTAGGVDLLAHPKMRLIAEYPLVMAVGDGTFASFADSGQSVPLPPSVTVPLVERTGVAELLALTREDELWRNRLGVALRDLLWWDGSSPEMTFRSDVILPASGIARLAGEANGTPVIVVAKAGHNDEPHNHNDVGSVVVSAGGVTYLCDPGSGAYVQSYFGPERYNNLFTRSLGHGVPYIGGTEQAAGARYRGELRRTGDKVVEIDFRAAYPVEQLEAAVRRIAIEPDGAVTLTDTFSFTGDGLAVQEGFMTWQDVEVDGSTARVVSPEGVLALRAAGGVFAVETFEAECLENGKEGVLKRITLDFPAAPYIEARVTMHYTPGSSSTADGGR